MNSTDDISDKELSELYHAASDERAPASLDRTVLELAREHVQMHNTNTRLRKLTPRFAWAAVIVLSIGVVLSIQFDNSGENLDISRLKSIPAYKPNKEEPAAKLAEKKMPAAPNIAEKLTFSDTTNAKAKKRQAPRQGVQENADAEAEAEKSPAMQILTEAPTDKSAALPPASSSMPDSESESDSASIAIGAAGGSGARGGLSQPSPPVASASATAPASKPAATPAPRLSRPAPALERKAAPAQKNISAFSPPQAKLKNKALDQQSQPSTSRLMTSTATVCKDLSPYACAVSTQCVLTKSDHGLSCRSAANRCESAFNQLTSSKSTCEGFAGCRYIDGDCECNKESEQCVCNSKGPALCLPIQ